MSAFLLPLPPIRPLPTGDGDAYELTEPLRWGDEQVAEGYVTDLASVPRPMRTLAPSSGLHTPAAIRHDARCDDLRAAHEAHLAGEPYQPDPLDGHRRLLTSRQADREFYRGIRQLDPRRPLRALVMWAGVRLGAVASPWRRDREAWLDLPAALAVCLLVAPLYLPVGVVNAAAQLVDAAAQRVACLLHSRLASPEPAGRLVDLDLDTPQAVAA